MGNWPKSEESRQNETKEVASIGHLLDSVLIPAGYCRWKSTILNEATGPESVIFYEATEDGRCNCRQFFGRGATSGDLFHRWANAGAKK